MQGPVRHQLPVAGFQFGGLGGIHQVVLVERHMHRCAGVGQQLHDEAVASSRRLAAIHQQQHQIHLADGAARGLHQALSQQVVWLVDAWGVHQHQLGGWRGEDRAQTVACGLGDRGGDGHLLAHQLVEQGGFAHVGPSHQGHKAGSEAFRAVS